MPPCVRNTSKYSLVMGHLVNNLLSTSLDVRKLFVLFLPFHVSLGLFIIKINLINKCLVSITIQITVSCGIFRYYLDIYCYAALYFIFSLVKYS